MHESTYKERQGIQSIKEEKESQVKITQLKFNKKKLAHLGRSRV